MYDEGGSLGTLDAAKQVLEIEFPDFAQGLGVGGKRREELRVLVWHPLTTPRRY